MLKHLSIQNFALIDQLNIDFKKGFSVITGETGSGKSIMLGALGLIIGERADLQSLKDKSKKCIIEGTFYLSSDKLVTFFEENDLDFETETIIRREITPAGKSRAFVNDTPVKLTLLKELGKHLIDIHSQHQTRLINQSDFQYHVLDTVGETQTTLLSYQKEYDRYIHLVKELESLNDLQRKAVQEQDFIRFQIEELSKIDLDTNKQEVEEEYNLLANAEDVIRLTNETENIINNEVSGVINGLQQLEYTIGKLEKIDSSYQPLAERVQSSIVEIQDLNFELNNKISSLEMDEHRLQELDDLLGEINHLEKKYNVLSIEELKATKEKLIQQENTFNSLEDSISKLEKEIAQQIKTVNSKGKKLSEERKKSAKLLEEKIPQYLKDLAMPNAKLKVQFSPLPSFNRNGLDAVSFLIKTNKGTDFSPLNKIASGGELSRIMLTIKAILAEKENLATLIFDEIDTGVSGEVANKMGEIMKKMGNTIQLISITHLPQIAGKGTTHYKVYKKDTNNETNTHIETLSDEQRIREVATMLSGTPPSKAAINNAKELLEF